MRVRSDLCGAALKFCMLQFSKNQLTDWEKYVSIHKRVKNTCKQAEYPLSPYGRRLVSVDIDSDKTTGVAFEVCPDEGKWIGMLSAFLLNIRMAGEAWHPLFLQD